MRMDKLTARFQTALQEAQSLAVGRDHQFIEPVHLMTALLDQRGGSVRHLFQKVGANVNLLRSRLGADTRHLAPGGSPTLRYLSQAIFPVYILHQTIIVVLAWQLRPLALPPLLEGPLLAMLTFGLAFAGYEAIRRAPPLRPLFGLKYRAPDTSRTAVGATVRVP